MDGPDVKMGPMGGPDVRSETIPSLSPSSSKTPNQAAETLPPHSHVPTMATNEEEMEETRRTLSLVAGSLPPPHAVLDLLSVGVCVRCIFRLFGVHGRAYSCPLITNAILQSFLEEQDKFHGDNEENGVASDGITRCAYASRDTENVQEYCSICLGILQLPLYQDQELVITKRVPVDDFTAAIAELVKQEDYDTDGFSFEVSIPPMVLFSGLTNFGELSIYVFVLRWFETNQKPAFELLPQGFSMSMLVPIVPLDRVSFKLNGGDLHLGFL
ncbi:hypothetical protein B296_00009330 [Ensete ventricosum]|uniref:Uncharacterized protein n=1 Tax=Ensete ventricosum TaxID=4639 RepID=A0A427B0V8_ENSVE|nr:hypothetical protein B296_00009330 [Ensete ventricosum]